MGLNPFEIASSASASAQRDGIKYERVGMEEDDESVEGIAGHGGGEFYGSSNRMHFFRSKTKMSLLVTVVFLISTLGYHAYATGKPKKNSVAQEPTKSKLHQDDEKAANAIVLDHSDEMNDSVMNQEEEKDEIKSNEIESETTTTTKTEESTDMTGLDAAIWDRLTPIQKAQVEHYRKGTALIINVHVTHHGGTTFCHKVRNGLPPAPDKSCMGDTSGRMPDPKINVNECKPYSSMKIDPRMPFWCYSYLEMRKQVPWSYDQTEPFAQTLRPYFHMISWEFSGPSRFYRHRNLNDTNWESPDVVSVIITRDPMSRLLASDGRTKREYPGLQDHGLSHKRWWDFALYKNEHETNNFFMRIIANVRYPEFTEDQISIPNHVEAGLNRTTEELMALFPTGIDESHFERAKALLNRATVVLDIACLDAGMDALFRLLRLNTAEGKTAEGKKRKKKKKKDPQPNLRRSLRKEKDHFHAPPRERIGYEDVYEYLLAKNHWDIELYKYSRTISLVRCDELS